MSLSKLESIILYEELLHKINDLTTQIKQEYPDQINCKIECCECCNNIFNISIIEGYYLQEGFDKLDQETINIVKDNALSIKEQITFQHKDKIDLKCPLLINNKCVIYDYRPIICRTFGSPMLDEKSGQIATCNLNFQNMRDKEYSLKTISSKMLSTQTVLLSQYLLREKGKDIPDDYVPPLYSVLEIIISEI
ncbi:MAG: YkgJ family cysteine cluster protein [Cyanobacteriota bacterium]